MEDWIDVKNIGNIFCILLVLVSCEQDPMVMEPEQPSSLEEYLIGDWGYTVLIIGGDTLNFPDREMEPNNKEFVGDLFHIRWRWFRYLGDGTYEFRKDTGITAEIGIGENFQPPIGYWTISDSDQVLIHNDREFYAVSYNIILLNDTIMIREYERIVQESSDTLKWPIGSTVTYREILVSRE